MVKGDLAPRALLHELELGDRINARKPVTCPPGLDHSHIRHKLDVSSRDVPSEKRERTSLFSTDHCGLIRQVHLLQCSTELYDTSKLLGISKSLIDALRARRELDLQLRPYRGKMTAPQLSMLEKQYLERHLLEAASLPRLSLFYLR